VGCGAATIGYYCCGVALWSWNVDTNRFTMDERDFHLWGVPLSGSVTFDDLCCRRAAPTRLTPFSYFWRTSSAVTDDRPMHQWRIRLA
jgi:hypothetical protein